MSLEMAILTTHTPRICHEEQAPSFQRPMVNALHTLAQKLADVRPEVVVLISCHWMSTFNHYVNANTVHKGLLTADECPDMIAGVPYHFPGHPEMALTLARAGMEQGLQVKAFQEPSYTLDYGTVVPLRYLLEKRKVPVVNLSVCWSSSLAESLTWGRIIGRVLHASPLRSVFVASGALSHNVVRNPAQWPNATETALNQKFCEVLENGDIHTAVEMLPSFAKAAGLESGGRHLATLLGVLQENPCKGVLHAYGPSSGSGNPIMSLLPAS
ncbi:MAG: extradiol ring-cleavage dioxygenase [Alicyclobacillus sp.]|nr:extradiol ring-cleavage dioxygenase [Alicyclobacillus sp.]